jgi:4a-hydroxytetrahydrobiopterin dehydratase
VASLAQERCVACRADAPRVSEPELGALRGEVPGWAVVERDGILRLERVFRFPDFAQAIAFTDRVGALAEAEGHHPRMELEWGRAAFTSWTHTAAGLTRNDFILAAKIDEIARA